MIIACPACTTRYVVPDSAIGPEGRTVRCAKCRHSWFQEGSAMAPQGASAAPLAEPPSAPPAPPAGPVRAPVPPPAEPPNFVTPPPPAAAPEYVEPAETEPPPFAEEALPPPPPVPQTFVSSPEETSQFEAAPPFRRRRNTLKLWTWAAAVFAVLAAATIVAVSYFGLPDWVPVARPTFGLAQPELQLEFPPGQQERRQLPNGTEFFGASGTITNVGSHTKSVPTILIVLRDAHDRIVYSWEVKPPKRNLAPGESVSVNEAVTDVPRSAKFAEIGWKPE